MFHSDANCFNNVTNPKHSAKQYPLHLTPLFEMYRYDTGIGLSFIKDLVSSSLATSLSDVLYRFEIWIS